MRSAAPPRRAFALVEMLVTITVLTVLLALAAGLIRVVLRLDGASREALAIATDQARLGHDLRADAHRATANPPPAVAPDRLTLTLPDQAEVVYTVRPRDLLREDRRGGTVRRREAYRRPAHSVARFELATPSDRPLVTLTIERDPKLAANPVEPGTRIEAEVGRIERRLGRRP